METEIWNFIKIWIVAIASASYAYSISRIFHIKKPIFRLFFILPIIYLFTILPFSLSSFHLGGPTFFYLVWLSNFKLILYSFHLGPLSSLPNTSLPLFISVALFPIKVNSKFTHNRSNPNKSLVLFGVKLLAFAVVIKIYDFRNDLPKSLLLVNYCCHLYLGVEVTLGITAALVRAVSGLGLDPQFDEPYLATSLQDFWGRRWNLMVSDILRLSAYDPIRRVALPLVGKKWAVAIGMMATFTVSGLMHELIYFYFTRVMPTWEVTWFFVLHGVCTALEVVVKEVVVQRFRLHRLISGPLTLGFIAVTAWWLFLPQILRSGYDVKVINEYPVMASFVKEKVLNFFTYVDKFLVV
ncbi:long-chain-alcohol O-fatty-acyltransferase-like [Chenopodium quinoa]|uniref:long-chain-alcohol O-fatty-acyltransferase-like n=1 Tax=Chenopodium quinoa TaxID=63459 RepID=UPI000B77FF24|nr:long-chain-alcohol O-fatty-acyltransferase-like [Chenopodium quinoa]